MRLKKRRKVIEMSCMACDSKSDYPDTMAYYRWKNANVGMIGCNKHLKEIFDALNEVQRKETKNE